MNIRGYLTIVRNDMDVNEHQGLSNITLKILVRNDMDVNEHQGLLTNISKERYGCK